jgi:hypothetical protein
LKLEFVAVPGVTFEIAKELAGDVFGCDLPLTTPAQPPEVTIATERMRSKTTDGH